MNGKRYICMATALRCAQIWAVLKPINDRKGEMEARDAAHVERPNGGGLKVTGFSSL